MSRFRCTESCRIHDPEDLRGDYIRGQDVWDSRLPQIYPALFSEIQVPQAPVFLPDQQEANGLKSLQIPEEDPGPSSKKKGGKAPATS